MFSYLWNILMITKSDRRERCKRSVHLNNLILGWKLFSAVYSCFIILKNNTFFLFARRLRRNVSTTCQVVGNKRFQQCFFHVPEACHRWHICIFHQDSKQTLLGFVFDNGFSGSSNDRRFLFLITRRTHYWFHVTMPCKPEHLKSLVRRFLQMVEHFTILSQKLMTSLNSHFAQDFF